MKKLILAASIAAIASSSASAATVYEGKGLTYKLKGDFQVQLRQDVGKDQSLDVEFDDLELKNSVVYDLNNGMKAFGQLDFGFKDAAEDKKDGSKLEEAYIGLDFGSVAVSVGKQNFATDEFGVEAAYELRSDADRFEAQGTDGDDTIRVDMTLENAYVSASYEIEAEGESSENGQSFDVFASTKVAGIKMALAYQTMEATPISDSKDTWGISAAYDFGVAKLAADFSTTEDVADQYNIAAIMPVDKTTKIAVGMLSIEPESGDDVTEWYANVTYKFPSQKNVSVFAEIADTDEDDVEIGYLAGMRLKF
ncbi:porin [Neptunomonas sp.]|uniref:porin n=1 Tax=Neptunomonas sp. TaxID=1971898 RepID=UPI0025D65BFF|nr:porin [Neptunomonas sp.]